MKVVLTDRCGLICSEVARYYDKQAELVVGISTICAQSSLAGTAISLGCGGGSSPSVRRIDMNLRTYEVSVKWFNGS